jgi:hypothetical protein
LELEARGGIEPPLKALQALALPLGYRAVTATTQLEGNPLCAAFTLSNKHLLGIYDLAIARLESTGRTQTATAPVGVSGQRWLKTKEQILMLRN